MIRVEDNHLIGEIAGLTTNDDVVNIDCIGCVLTGARPWIAAAHALDLPDEGVFTETAMNWLLIDPHLITCLPHRNTCGTKVCRWIGE